MLFILFDVEAIFLIPGPSSAAVTARCSALSEMIIYIAIVVVGFLYMWKKGVLDWAMARPTTRAVTEHSCR